MPNIDWTAAFLSIVRHAMTTVGGISVTYTTCVQEAAASGNWLGAGLIAVGAAWGVAQKRQQGSL